MRNSRLFDAVVLAGLLMLAAGSAVEAASIPQKSVNRSGIIPAYAPEVVLYSQLDSPGTNSTGSQNFEVANDAFDTELADDFVVPAGGWAIDNVTTASVYFNGTGPAPTVHVAFYSNSGALPGAAVAGCDYPAVVPVDTTGSFSIALAPACSLAPGTYWVSVVANMNFAPGGQWGWTDRTVVSNSPAAWRNPGGGFGTTCTAWGVRNAACGIDPGVPDQLFSLSGATLPVELTGFAVE
ncbi:MAG: hypothetical protein ABI689_19090 [Thermoanaerobaculia bacterium]